MIRPTRSGDCCWNLSAMVADFESDLIRLRTREGMKVAKAKGRLRGKRPKLKPNQAKHLLGLHDPGNYTQAELAELFRVGRSTIYRTIDAMRPQPVVPERPFAHIVVPPWPNTETSAQRELSAKRLTRPSVDGGAACQIQAKKPNLSRGLFVRYRFLWRRQFMLCPVSWPGADRTPPRRNRNRDDECFAR